MYRMPIILLLAVLLAASPMAQEAEPENDANEEAVPAETTAVEDESSPLDDVTDEEIEELLGLDEDYEEADDGFDPTIEVRVKDAIVFPVDI